jgi:hypothetical protein
MDPVRIRDWSADLSTSTMGGSAALCPDRPIASFPDPPRTHFEVRMADYRTISQLEAEG